MAKTQAQLREEAEMKAAELRAARAMQVAEAEAKKQEEAKAAYDDIWAAFSKDLKKGKSYANANLLDNLTIFASYLVPTVMTAKEHTSLIMELAEKTTGEKGTSSGEDPMDLMSKWLQGSVDLSRIPLKNPRHYNDADLSALPASHATEHRRL